jgi:Domain of unknown function (DUF6968)
MPSGGNKRTDARANAIVRREVTLARGRKREPVLLEIFPAVRVENGDCKSRVVLTTKTRQFESSAYGVDSLQAVKLAIKAADAKIRLLASANGADAYFLGPGMPPVFDELESLERLSKSLVNCLDALQFARALLVDREASVSDRQDAAQQLSRVIESAGIMDTDGQHIRRRRDIARGSGWKETELRRSKSSKHAPVVRTKKR